MTAAEALTHMRDPDSLGVRTGSIDCFMVGSTGVIECDAPDGEGVVDVPADDFVQRFEHHRFRKLKSEDFGQ